MPEVTLRFGTTPGRAVTFEFDTDAELEAFAEGIDAAVGWMEYWVERAPASVGFIEARGHIDDYKGKLDE